MCLHVHSLLLIKHVHGCNVCNIYDIHEGFICELFTVIISLTFKYLFFAVLAILILHLKTNKINIMHWT